MARQALHQRITAEILGAKARDDRWVLVSLSYEQPGRVGYGADSVFHGFEGHREIRGPRWRDFDNARTFADVGYRWFVAGPITMAVLAKHLVGGGRPVGVAMHAAAAQRWTPRCAEPSPVINSVNGFVGQASPRYGSLGAPRPGRATRRRLTSQCYYCGSTQDLTLHHLVRREMGGATEPANLLCVCRTCHERIHRDEIDDTDLVQDVWRQRLDNELGRLRSE